MKGTQGLIIAAILGLGGAFCNWFYITRLAANYEKISFVAIDSNAQINQGDRFKKEHFVRVEIPKNNVGHLRYAAVLWKDRSTAYGYPAPRAYAGGEILLGHDLTTPSQIELTEMLGENEVARWVPVDSRTFVPEKVNPGDDVSFVVPRLAGGAVRKTTNSRELLAGPTEVIGPFRILALGTRTGRRELRKAAGLSSGPEHVITIGVRFENGKMDDHAERLFDVLRLTGNKGVQVMLHSAKKAKRRFAEREP